MSAGTSVGRRMENQDFWLVDEGLGLMVVADGIGGLPCGAIASRLACEELRRRIGEGQFLDEALHGANAALEAESRRRGLEQRMGTTLVAMLWRDDRFRLIWVGDSPAVSFADGQLRALSVDHSEVADLVRAGVLTAAESRGHPSRNLLTQALGVTHSRELRPGLNQGGLRHGEWVLLASDGLFEKLTPKTVSAALDEARDSEEAVQLLLQLADAAGTGDNVTVLAGMWSGESAGKEDLPRAYGPLDPG